MQCHCRHKFCQVSTGNSSMRMAAPWILDYAVQARQVRDGVLAEDERLSAAVEVSSPVVCVPVCRISENFQAPEAGQ
ncbi:hypothetical protein BD626DRAFT_502181 [Schizophyllum amplum]|uniref:Uncharacterized protein n=1 Tax=Schizophyllum amplum TaxID=97359 RepID=A0A550C959_9AGAR|nr:hypothetical protein BD626DRAFT_502181 [Auriculariopsis ampla]